MGTNTGKEIRKESTFVNNSIQPKSVVSRSDSEFELSERLPRQKNQRNKLQNPDNQRPIELSWLQQNNTNENYSRINQQQHQHHRHHHHDQDHSRRIPLAINRWSKDGDENEIEKRKAKSFIEEYIHQ